MVNFKTEKISERVTRIFGICTELMYLIEGEEKAVLIDTGSGFGSLKTLVEKLTDKPIIVLLTHGHTDHAMGAGEFETVYMNHEDEYIFKPHGDSVFRWDGVSMSSEYSTVTQQDYIPTDHVSRFLEMREGDVFDLGNCTIEIYECAGHTKGSVVMLYREENMLFLGDACNNNTFLFEDYSLPIHVYKENLIKLKKKVEGKFDIALSFHGDGKLPVQILDEVIEVCDEIETGNTDDVPMVFRGNHGWIAKSVGKDGKRLDGKCGNIVYNKENII